MRFGDTGNAIGPGMRHQIGCHKSIPQEPPLRDFGGDVVTHVTHVFHFGVPRGKKSNSQNRVTRVTNNTQRIMLQGVKLVTHARESCVTIASPTSPGCFGEL